MVRVVGDEGALGGHKGVGGREGGGGWVIVDVFTCRVSGWLAGAGEGGGSFKGRGLGVGVFKGKNSGLVVVVLFCVEIWRGIVGGWEGFGGGGVV